MPRVRSTPRALTQARQRWYLERTSSGNAVVASNESAHVTTLEDLSRITWMGIAASALLFVASLPGGLFTVVSMLAGVALGVTGLLVHHRATHGRAVVPPQLDVDHERLRRLAHARVLAREFGRAGSLPAPGRRIEVFDVHAVRAIFLRTPEGDLRAVLLDAAEDGLVLVNGALVRLEVDEGTTFCRRTRIEALPRTRGVLSLSSFGQICESLVVSCDDAVLAWLGGCRDLERLEIEGLPWALAEKLGASVAPYRV